MKEGKPVRECDCLTCALKSAASDWFNKREGRSDDAVNSNEMLNSMSVIAAEILSQQCPDMLTRAVSAASFAQAVISVCAKIEEMGTRQTRH